jgi:hypothetical protein
MLNLVTYNSSLLINTTFTKNKEALFKKYYSYKKQFAMFFKKNIVLFITYLTVTICLLSCSKEYSYEGDPLNFGISNGTLRDELGNCKEIEIYGQYAMDSALNANNYLMVKINFSSTGKWLIYSDTVNGVWFRDSGYTVAVGNQIVKVKGYGSPILPNIDDFKIRYRNTSCNFKLDCRGIGTPGTNGDYFPTTTNSSWTYFNSSINDTITIKVDRFDITKAGNDYRQFMINFPLGQRDTLYYRKDGLGNYYRYYTIANGPNRDHIFLKDNVAVNTNWVSPSVPVVVAGIPQTARLQFTILQKDYTATIGTRTVDSVIRVREDIQYELAGTFRTVSSNEHFFAKKIGQVDFKQINVVAPISITARRWQIF